MKTGVLVIGGGGAGLCAAISAWGEGPGEFTSYVEAYATVAGFIRFYKTSKSFEAILEH